MFKDLPYPMPGLLCEIAYSSSQSGVLSNAETPVERYSPVLVSLRKEMYFVLRLLILVRPSICYVFEFL